MTDQVRQRISVVTSSQYRQAPAFFRLQLELLSKSSTTHFNADMEPLMKKALLVVNARRARLAEVKDKPSASTCGASGQRQPGITAGIRTAGCLLRPGRQWGPRPNKSLGIL